MYLSAVEFCLLHSFLHSFMTLFLSVATDNLLFEPSEFLSIVHRGPIISKLAVNLVLDGLYYLAPNFSWIGGAASWNVLQILLYFHAKRFEYLLSDGILDIRISRFENIRAINFYGAF